MLRLSAYEIKSLSLTPMKTVNEVNLKFIASKVNFLPLLCIRDVSTVKSQPQSVELTVRRSSRRWWASHFSFACIIVKWNKIKHSVNGSLYKLEEALYSLS